MNNFVALLAIAGLCCTSGLARAETMTETAQSALPSPERAQELLFDAARTGRADLIGGLLQLGASIDAHDPKGNTPLIIAAYAGEEATVATLLSAGADACKGDTTRGNTALMGAAFRGHDAVAQRLLAAGCDVDARNNAGQTALMMAAMFGRTAQVDLLLGAGADPRAIDAQGNSAASLAAMQGQADLAQRLGG